MLHRRLIMYGILCLAAVSCLAAAGGNPMIGACPVFPPDNIWNTEVDRLPLDPKSQQYIQSIGSDLPAHADFGSGLYNGAPIGIPFMTMPGNQKRVRIKFEYSEESDLSNYPIPANAPIEGGLGSKGDRHVLLIDRDNCVLWEVYSAYPQPDGTWRGGAGAIFDLKSNSLRPDSWTSADAAGLPIFPGLVRYEEVAAGEIRHALRFTIPHTRKAHMWPARHDASRSNDPNLPPLGERFRLKASFDISSFSPQMQVILRALKIYGMLLADNGGPWFISGSPDDRWDNKVLAEMRNVKGSDFEAVVSDDLFVAHHSARAKSQQ